jgi:dihydroorotase
VIVERIIVNNHKLFQQIRILNPADGIDEVTDVLVTGNIIADINQGIKVENESTEIIDGTGLIFAPGLVDLYSYSGEPGFEERETLDSLSASALRGGFTRVGILPQTNPVVDSLSMVSWLKSKVNSSDVNFYIWGALTKDLAGETMAQLGELAEAGVVGFTDNRPHGNLQLLRKLLEYAQPFNLPVALVPNNLNLSGNGVMRESHTSIRLGLRGCPDIAESVAIASLLEIASFTKTPIHLMRISTAKGVELIRQGKEKGINVTASINWHHLLLETEMIASYNPHLRFEPPLGTLDDRLALLQGVKTGIIDAIAIDHQGYTYEEKTVAFAQAPPGAIGLQLALPLLWQNLVMTEELTPLELWRSLSVNPLKCLGKSPIKLEKGKPSEYIVFAPQERWQVTPSKLKSLSYNTYWLNKELQGKVY